jgi:hypothetical protein
MKHTQPKCVGYFPKKTEKVENLGPGRKEWEGIKEICSVSECISEGPDGWIDHWKHNELCFYNSESIALEIIPDDDAKYDIYAYKIFPIRFNNGKIEAYKPPFEIKCDIEDYVFLGYDIVSKTNGSGFDCSPLSCNGAHKEFQVNEFCLIDNYEKAHCAAIEISKGNYEAGQYYIFEVYRKAD